MHTTPDCLAPAFGETLCLMRAYLQDVVKIMNFNKPTRELRSRLLATTSQLPESELKELNLFTDLLDKCLNLNPEKRCTPAEALKHPFIYRMKA